MYTKSIIIASAALMASTAVASPGSAIIVNACQYPVYLAAVPSADGGYSEIDKTLASGETWSQEWTALSNGNGWSLKLSKDDTFSSTDILQYEYTYQNDGTIWYDLSCVNGNPWDGNWEITASGLSTCIPKQSYYRYATDDAYGMQSCGSDASVTVTLCSGESAAESIVSSVVAAAATTATSTSKTSTSTTTVAVTTTSTPTSTTSATTTSSAHMLGFGNGHFYDAEEVKETSYTSTTLATTTTAVSGDDDYVTVVEMVVETAIAYETYVPGKRHVHHPNHPHFR